MIAERTGFARTLALFWTGGLALQIVFLGMGTVALSLLGRGVDWNSALVGCGITLIGGCIGSIPVSWKLAHDPPKVGVAVLASTMLRFVTVLGLVALTALLTPVNRVSLVVWVGVGYMLVLVADTLLAISLMKRMTAKATS